MSTLRLTRLPVVFRLHSQLLHSHTRRCISSIGCISQQMMLQFRDNIANSGSRNRLPLARPCCCRIQQVRCGHYDKWTDLLYEDLLALLESGDVQLIDVREAKEIQEQGSFPKAINIPLGDLKVTLQLDDMAFTERYSRHRPHHHDTNIVFVGYGPIKSSAALEIAQKIGYKKARHYVGGYEEWAEKHKKS